MALQTSRLMTCPMAKGRTPPLGLVAGTIRAARYVPRISVGTSPVASLQKASTRCDTGLRQIRSSKSSARTFHHQVPWLCWRERI